MSGPGHAEPLVETTRSLKRKNLSDDDQARRSRRYFQAHKDGGSANALHSLDAFGEPVPVLLTTTSQCLEDRKIMEVGRGASTVQNLPVPRAMPGLLRAAGGRGRRARA